MKIVVISRKSDCSRRKKMSSMLELSPYEWSFFDACEPNTLPIWFEEVYDENKCRKYRSYPLVPGEKGCFASHVKVWEMAMSMDESLVVLEDDCTLTEHFFSKLDEIKNENYEYIKLERRSNGVSIDSNLMMADRNRSGTVGYYINPIGAFKLLSNLNTIYTPIDHYIGMCWKHSVAPISLKSPIITHEGDFGTSIQNSRKESETEASNNKILRFRRKVIRYIDNYKYKKFTDKVMKKYNV
ncbi:glycosyltransferase family 25 protein [Vibrio rumoiensis]|uniref:Glycosyltransferase family 25 protein n=1 Tax=Vibrio rumoiensis TaxID=76258 RepID=A0ABW7IT02_9VIBR